MRTLGVIPARYASTRFPGKPLAEINGKPMLYWTYMSAKKAQLDDLVVAIDDHRIEEMCKAYQIPYVMTLPTHQSGTERCAEVAASKSQFDSIINIQGDEPFTASSQITALHTIMLKKNSSIATLIKPIKNKEELQNPNRVKVVVNKHFKALYFSRSLIPYQRNSIDPTIYYKHIGLYAYKREVLLDIARLPSSILEQNENLEQLRWLENGYDIYTGVTHVDSISVDTPEDLKKISDHGV